MSSQNDELSTTGFNQDTDALVKAIGVSVGVAISKNNDALIDYFEKRDIERDRKRDRGGVEDRRKGVVDSTGTHGEVVKGKRKKGEHNKDNTESVRVDKATLILDYWEKHPTSYLTKEKIMHLFNVDCEEEVSLILGMLTENDDYILFKGKPNHYMPCKGVKVLADKISETLQEDPWKKWDTSRLAIQHRSLTRIIEVAVFKELKEDKDFEVTRYDDGSYQISGVRT